jgi:hypothetical protein
MLNYLELITYWELSKQVIMIISVGHVNFLFFLIIPYAFFRRRIFFFFYLWILLDIW